MLTNFKLLVDSLKAKPYPLLDFANPAFDTDIADFNASVVDLETALQRFINQSFETISSTEQALALLRKYQAILQARPPSEALTLTRLSASASA